MIARPLNSQPQPLRALNKKGSVIDLMDGPETRAYLESLRFQQKSVRATWDSQYYQLRAFFAPRDGRVDPSQVNYGGRQDFKIINEVGIHSLHILASGMLTGMSNQTRFWFSMHCENRECDMLPDVRQWFERVDYDVSMYELVKETITYGSVESVEVIGNDSTGQIFDLTVRS